MRDDLSFLRDLERTIDAIDEKPYRKYWNELGHFIHVFSETEYWLLLLLHKYAGVKPKIAGVIFSGTRSDAAKDQIKAILDATEKPKILARLERPLAQMATINTIRNHLIHWGATHSRTKKLRVSNALLYPSAKRLKEFSISPEDLRAMRQDLYRISAYFMLELYPRRQRFWSEWLAKPWLYKPPQPSQRRKGSGKTRSTRRSR